MIVIFAGLVANLVMGLLPPPSGSAAARGQAFGRGAATLVALIAGVVLIVMHFMRKRRSPGRTRPRARRESPRHM
ncbi:MAG TPA: hypothetical protein VML55_01910 [Planctomycetaceae bacterium]|nr:hypothetical protein [Planctomycetaceae bacterium]